MPRPSRLQTSSSSRRHTPPRRARGTESNGSARARFPDDEMFDAVQMSQDAVLDAGLRAIARRLDARNVMFLKRSEIASTSISIDSVVDVRDEVVHYGSITASRITPAARRTLPALARWLAAWLGLQRRFESLQSLALTDPVTGAWNRRYFDAFLASALDQAVAAAPEARLSVVILDIDNFKAFNDRHGHEAGDAVLRETVRLLASVIRPSDRICRIGGDEFAVIFFEPPGSRNNRPVGRTRTSVAERNRDTAGRDISAIIHRFQSRLAHARPIPTRRAARNRSLRLTASAGLASFPKDGRTHQTLLRTADSRLLESKNAGKNCLTLR